MAFFGGVKPSQSVAQSSVEKAGRAVAGMQKILRAGAAETVAGQESALRSVYRPLVADAADRVASQQAMLDPIIQLLGETATNNIMEQSVMLGSVTTGLGDGTGTSPGGTGVETFVPVNPTWDQPVPPTEQTAPDGGDERPPGYLGPVCSPDGVGHWEPNPTAPGMPIWVPPCPDDGGNVGVCDADIECPPNFHTIPDPNDPTICICVPDDDGGGDPDDPICPVLPCCGSDTVPLDPCCPGRNYDLIDSQPAIMWGVGNPGAASDIPRKYHVFIKGRPHKMPPGRRIYGPLPYKAMRQGRMPAVLENHDVIVGEPCDDAVDCDTCRPPVLPIEECDNQECPPGYHLEISALDPTKCVCVKDGDEQPPGDGGTDPGSGPPWHLVTPGCVQDDIPIPHPWSPGDPFFCSYIPNYVAALAEVGRRIRPLMLDGIDVIANITEIFDPLKNLPFIGGFIDRIVKLITFPTGVVHELLCSLRAVIGSNLMPGMEAAIGLEFTRAAVRSLSTVAVGIDIGPVFAGTVGIHFKQIEEILDYLVQYVSPTQVLTAETTRTAYLADEISQSQAECYFRLNNTTLLAQQPLIDSMRGRVTANVIGQLWNRGAINRAEYERQLRLRGFTKQEDVRHLDATLDYLPPPSDVIRFAYKDVFDPNKRGREAMLAELTEQDGLRELMAAQGIGSVTISPPGYGAKTYDIVSAYWLASFTDISPTQSAEMLHRLRPDRVRRFGQVVQGLSEAEILKLMPNATIEQNPDGPGLFVIPAPYQLSDHAKLLKEDDYNPNDRIGLAAISYRNPTRVDLRRFYQNGSLGLPAGREGWDTASPDDPKPKGAAEREVTEYYRDQGYSDLESRRLGYFAAFDYDMTVRQKENDKHLKRVCEAYQLGAIDKPTANALAERYHRYPQVAFEFVDDCDRQRSNRELSAAVKAVRSQYITGRTDEAGATAQLGSVGILSDRVVELLRLWAIEKAGRSKEMTAAKFCDWYGKGLLDVDMLRDRLRRIGYLPDNVDRIVAHCQIGILARTEKELDKRRRAILAEEEKAKRLAEKERKRKEAERGKMLADERRGFNEGTLKTALKRGVIDNGTAAGILSLLDWDQDAINLWISTWGRRTGPLQPGQPGQPGLT